MPALEMPSIPIILLIILASSIMGCIEGRRFGFCKPGFKYTLAYSLCCLGSFVISCYFLTPFIMMVVVLLIRLEIAKYLSIPVAVAIYVMLTKMFYDGYFKSHLPLDAERIITVRIISLGFNIARVGFLILTIIYTGKLFELW